MSTFATQPVKERELFFRQYQQRRGVDPVIVEKDFGRIFAEPKLADACVFKGGTSLSKVFNAIARFSEDIDLAILPESLGWKEEDLDQAPSRTKREERVTELEAACAVAVQKTWQPLLERAIQAALGSPTESGDWLAYQFEEGSRSPVLIFAYPGALPRRRVHRSPGENRIRITHGSAPERAVPHSRVSRRTRAGGIHGLQSRCDCVGIGAHVLGEGHDPARRISPPCRQTHERSARAALRRFRSVVAARRGRA